MAVAFDVIVMKSKLMLIKIAIVFLIGSFAGNILEVRAQSFKRIQKDGVIYYYFSDRNESWDRKAYLKICNRKIKVLPLNRKVSHQELEPVVQEASRHYNLPPTLIKAMIRVESNFVPTATSPKGAQGLMQLMPATAKDLQVRNAYDIRENVWAGTRYLYIMLKKFGNHLPLALAAYNAGPQRVEQSRGIPQIKETQRFVQDVCTNFLVYHGGESPPQR